MPVRRCDIEQQLILQGRPCAGLVHPLHIPRDVALLRGGIEGGAPGELHAVDPVVLHGVQDHLGNILGRGDEGHGLMPPGQRFELAPGEAELAGLAGTGKVAGPEALEGHPVAALEHGVSHEGQAA